MASSVAVAQPVSEGGIFRRFIDLIPGVLLLVAVGYAGKIIERSIAQYGKAHHLTLPNIEYVLWAIVIGLVISNTVGIPRIFQAGIATYEFWLKAGIVLLGSRFLLGDVAKLGGISLVLVVIEIALSLVFMTYLGRAFGLSPKLTTLLAVRITALDDETRFDAVKRQAVIESGARQFHEGRGMLRRLIGIERENHVAFGGVNPRPQGFCIVGECAQFVPGRFFKLCHWRALRARARLVRSAQIPVARAHFRTAGTPCRALAETLVNVTERS